MRDVHGIGSVDQSRFPGYTRQRRFRPWLRTLAVTCLAATMIGGPSIVARGITSGASALVLAPNKPCSALSAKAAGHKFCLKADAGNSRVQLTWRASAPVGSVIVYYAPANSTGHPAAFTNVTDKSALVIDLKNRIGYAFWLVDGKTAVSDPVPATPAATPAAAPGT